MTELKRRNRILSLDVFRGITVAAMIFVNITASADAIPYFLHHAEWEGLYFGDLVFPFFLFIGGISMAFAFANKKNKSLKQQWSHFISRIIILFVLGVFINWIWDPTSLNVRIPGVLQLIALSSLFAAPFAKNKSRWILLVASILILVNSIIFLYVKISHAQPGTSDHFMNIMGWIDVQTFGSNHILNSNFDPEGILALIPSTVLLLLGLTLGRTLQNNGENNKTLLQLFIAGILALLIGFILSYWIPLVKQLWTSSFILITAGLGTLIFSILYFYLDIKKIKSILLITLPLGRNALFIYILSMIVMVLIECYVMIPCSDGSLISLYEYIFSYDIPFLGPMCEQILFGLLFVLFYMVIAAVLHRKKIYIKL
ncbi:MAG: heparan-alpha-glucosaminide N-acetyltransferase domain-containing protein [Methanobrevibacter sp.]|jgi:predicted acyltransferase|nr:heparan-alpha-glucosaminide N-acetyltransferase domain-containing protein [Candidatus Methanovirga aequatorialis]